MVAIAQPWSVYAWTRNRNMDIKFRVRRPNREKTRTLPSTRMEKHSLMRSFRPYRFIKTHADANTIKKINNKITTHGSK